MTLAPLWIVLMLLARSGDEPRNPWKERVAPAAERARQTQSVDAYREALDAAWRGDDWQAGLTLARAAIEKHARDGGLRGYVVRALWRAGLIAEAERLAADIPRTTEDPVALQTLVGIHLARGQNAEAGEVADKLARFKEPTAADLYQVISARMALNRYDGIVELLRQAHKLTDAKNGYPEIYVEEMIEGLAEFFTAVGSAPLNQVARFGSAEMPVTPLVNLPGCMAMINGKGPYRLIVDTGGSIMLSIDDAVAEEIGLKSIVQGSIRGVSGKDSAGQALVDELKLGDITCKRVMTRVFGVRKATLNSCDGIIGTGIFSQARMTLDFHGGKLVVSASSGADGSGNVVDLRIVGDAKLVSVITINKEPAAAILDSGADVAALTPSRLKRLFPDRPVTSITAPMAGVGTGDLPQVSLTGGVDLSFAGRTFDNFGGLGLDVLDTTLSPILGLQSDMLIGMPVFREMKSCTVDFPRCKMWVEWLK